MNWKKLRLFPWLDTRAGFVARTPQGGSLLDLGSADGETLRHIAELRPDLRLFSVDLQPHPESYPPNCQTQKADLERDRLPWPDNSMSMITSFHLVEHLRDLDAMCREVKRLLRPGGEVYIETPHPKTLTLPSPTGKMIADYTLNFFDDTTHIRPVVMGALAKLLKQHGLEPVASGTSRNWIFAASFLAFQFMPSSRQKYTAKAHWIGWSAYIIARKPAGT